MSRSGGRALYSIPVEKCHLLKIPAYFRWMAAREPILSVLTSIPQNDDILCPKRHLSRAQWRLPEQVWAFKDFDAIYRVLRPTPYLRSVSSQVKFQTYCGAIISACPHPVEIRTHNPAQYFLERNLEQCKEIPRFYYFQEIVAYYVVHSALICATN